MSSPQNPPPPLRGRDLDPDPHAQFAAWLAAARAAGVHEPEAMSLATADAAGRPSVRVVLLRGYGPDGYVWYTNRASRKGRELAENPVAALALHWAPLGRQIRIEGPVTPIGDEESDRYFASRPRESRIGAWASEQSEPVADRDVLDARVALIAERFDGVEVPRPPNWGGYRLVADAMEFWQHREGRLHDRFRYTGGDGAWTRVRLAP